MRLNFRVRVKVIIVRVKVRVRLAFASCEVGLDVAQVIEIKRQFDLNPNLLIPNHPDRPDYDKCIRISTDASLKEMVAPGALASRHATTPSPSAHLPAFPAPSALPSFSVSLSYVLAYPPARRPAFRRTRPQLITPALLKVRLPHYFALIKAPLHRCFAI